MATRALHGADLNRVAFSATAHCLTGCGIGEVLGLAIATALDWSDLPSIALAVALAFLFGYSLTLLPVLRSGVDLYLIARGRGHAVAHRHHH